MAASKVYFTTFHTTLEENIQQKLSRLLLTAGMDQIHSGCCYITILHTDLNRSPNEG